MCEMLEDNLGFPQTWYVCNNWIKWMWSVINMSSAWGTTRFRFVVITIHVNKWNLLLKTFTVILRLKQLCLSVAVQMQSLSANYVPHSADLPWCNTTVHGGVLIQRTRHLSNWTLKRSFRQPVVFGKRYSYEIILSQYLVILWQYEVDHHSLISNSAKWPEVNTYQYLRVFFWR